MKFESSQIGEIKIETVLLPRATMEHAAEFKERIKSLVGEGTRALVVDLGKCEFVDSTFLGALVVVLKSMIAVGGDIRLVGFTPAVRTMLELTRLFRVFECFDSLDDAVKSFSTHKIS